LGSVTCTPMAFTFPALFHLKACAETTPQKILDLFIIVLSVLIFFYCTYKGIVEWSVDDHKPVIYYNAV
jgi:amino acid permease